MGTGKVVIQAFLQFRNLNYVYGVELSIGRYKIAEEAVLSMVEMLGVEHFEIQVNPGKFIVVREYLNTASYNSLSGCERGGSSSSGCDVKEADEDQSEHIERVLHLECGNMFDISNMTIVSFIL